jgi:hypothetical protein
MRNLVAQLHDVHASAAAAAAVQPCVAVHVLLAHLQRLQMMLHADLVNIFLLAAQN